MGCIEGSSYTFDFKIFGAQFALADRPFVFRKMEEFVVQQGSVIQ
jgi:hypothetical protein